MNKQTMIRNYRRFSAAEGYILGFIYKHMVYYILVDEVMPRYMRLERTSSRNGNIPKLQFRLNNKHMEELIRKGATCLGDESILTGEYNKGVEFERLVDEIYGFQFRGKENVGFWVEGDLQINGKEIQVKLNGAQMALESTLKNLQKKARATK